MDSGLVYHADTFVERRKNPRIPIKIVIHYQQAKIVDPANIVQTQSFNLAVQGSAMYTAHKLETNSLVNICLFIPKEYKWDTLTPDKKIAITECRKIDIQSQVVWCLPAEDGRFRCGLEFKRIKAEDQAYLKEFLLNFKMPSPNNTSD